MVANDLLSIYFNNKNGKSNKIKWRLIVSSNIQCVWIVHDYIVFHMRCRMKYTFHLQNFMLNKMNKIK